MSDSGWNLDMDAQRAKYVAGLKGGPFNSKPYTPPPMTVVDIVDGQVKTEFQGKAMEKMPIIDTWNNRRSK